MKYQVNIILDQQTLSMVRSQGVSIVLAQSFSGMTPNVAWANVNPSLHNEILWEAGRYALYASGSPLTEGAVLIPAAVREDAQIGSLYGFTGHEFNGPRHDASIPPDSCAVRNESGHGPVSAGLAQTVIVNGEQQTFSPACAFRIAGKETAAIRMHPTMCIWVQPRVASGTVVSPPHSYMFVHFPNGVATQTIRYTPQGFIVERNLTEVGKA